MLNLNIPTKVQLLINFLVFLTKEPPTIKGGGRRRRGGGPMSSSLPNHDAKEQKGKTEKRQMTKTRKTKGRLQVCTKM